MNASLSAHGGLTPGREGKGREQGRERKGSVSSPWPEVLLVGGDQGQIVTYVTREQAIGIGASIPC